MEKENNHESAEPNDYTKLWLKDRFVERQEYEKYKQEIQEELDIHTEQLAKNTYYLSIMSNVLNKAFWPIIVATVLIFVSFGINKILY